MHDQSLTQAEIGFQPAFRNDHLFYTETNGGTSVKRALRNFSLYFHGRTILREFLYTHTIVNTIQCESDSVAGRANGDSVLRRRAARQASQEHTPHEFMVFPQARCGRSTTCNVGSMNSKLPRRKARWRGILAGFVGRDTARRSVLARTADARNTACIFQKPGTDQMRGAR